jgi:hypothetical protein
MTSSRYHLVAAGLVLALILQPAPKALGQTSSSGSAESSDSSESAGSQSLRRHLSIRLEFAGIFDSNIDHEVDAQESLGGVAGVRARLRTSPRRPLLVVEYRGAVKSFSNSSRWDRVEHRFGAILARRFGAVTLETAGDLSLRASTEDRELGNQYTVKPRLSVQLGDGGRLRLYGAYRLRVFDPPNSDEEIRFAGAAFRWRAGGNSLELETRYEDSESDDSRRRYTRWRHSAEYQGKLSDRDLLTLGLEYRPRRFPDELVDSGGFLESREDVRWIPSVSLRHRFPLGRELRVEYEYQLRDSNDPDKEYRAHRLTFMVRLPLLSPYSGSR